MGNICVGPGVIYLSDILKLNINYLLQLGGILIVMGVGKIKAVMKGNGFDKSWGLKARMFIITI